MFNMELKVAQGIKLNQEQVREVAELVMSEPDMGWEYDYDTNHTENHKTGVYVCELDADHGTYVYRVNLSFGLITLLEVK